MLRLIKLVLKILLAINLLAWMQCISANSLKDIKITQEISSIRITCDLTKKCDYHCFILKNPERLVIDLPDVQLPTKLSQPKEWLLPVIKNIRTSTHNKKEMRLVFELDHSISFKSTQTKDNNIYHLVIDIVDDAQKQKKNVSKQETISDEKFNNSNTKSNGKQQKNEETVVLETPSPISLSVNLPLEEKPKLELSKHKNSRNIVVVIDPGHGGKDPGATGVNGTREKDVVLKISKLLQKLINEEPGYCAVLTRTTDYYIPLRKRLAIARKNHADMFVAIHADAYHHGHAAGASVFALSQRGATSEAAKWLADKENESELGGLSSELADKDAVLRSVLIDLSQTHTIEASLQIGQAVLHHLGKFTPLHHPRVEQAAFVVLKSPDIPSILVETGFLSNPHEENKLSDHNYQKQTAYALKQGIIHYFEINPPNGNLFSNRKPSKDKIALSDKKDVRELSQINPS